MLLSFSGGSKRARLAIDSECGSTIEWADRVVRRADVKATQDVAIVYRRAVKKLAEVQMYLNLMSTDEMILILKIEDFLTRHSYIGKHWMKMMGRLVDKYERK